MAWLAREVNSAWERRGELTPKYEAIGKPQMIQVLKRLPGTNCKKCGQATCMVFAVMLTQFAVGIEDCPELGADMRGELTEYLAGFGPAAE